MQKTRVLKDRACVNLQNAVTDLETDGDKRSIAEALDHAREAEAVLQMLLAEIDGRENAAPASGKPS